jgi:hypothetical protein
LWALACIWALGACGGDDSPKPPASDAAPPVCSDFDPLVIGQCIDLGTGKPCLDFLATERSWPALGDTPLVPGIIGLQGSPMFVMSVSGLGIEPGSDSDSPYVQLDVTQGDEQVGSYSARPTVISDPNNPGQMLAPQLYVVAFFARDLVGQTVQVKAQVRDLNEDEWCTEGSFQVGAIADDI